jgi:hypothetical protein
MKVKITKACQHGIHKFVPPMVIEATPGLVTKLLESGCGELVQPKPKRTSKKKTIIKEEIIPAEQTPVTDENNISEP